MNVAAIASTAIVRFKITTRLPLNQAFYVIIFTFLVAHNSLIRNCHFRENPTIRLTIILDLFYFRKETTCEQFFSLSN